MEYSASNPLIIDSEESAINAIKRLLSGEISCATARALQFDGWPVTRAYVAAKHLDSALTPYMMEGYIDLQRSLFRSYALLTQGDGNARRLSEELKSQLELVVKVESGSSDGSIDWTEVLNKVLEGLVNKMEPTHIVITVISLALIYGGVTILLRHLDGKKEERLAEISNKTTIQTLEALKFSTEKDVERFKIIESAISNFPKLRAIEDDAVSARESVVKHYTRDQDALIDGVHITQEAGKQLTRNSRALSTTVHLDRIYRINRVDSTSPIGFRVKLEDLETRVEIDAGVQDAILSQEQKAILRDAEWGKTPVRALIDAREKDGEIFDAVVMKVEAAPRSNTNDSKHE